MIDLSYDRSLRLRAEGKAAKDRSRKTKPICAYLIDWLHAMPLTPLADNTVDDGHTDDDDDGHIDGDEDDDDDDDDDSQHSITTTTAVQQLSFIVEDRDDEQR